MKSFRSIASIALLLSAAVVSACDETAVQNITEPPAASRVRFFNFGVNAPSVNFYANNTKVTAITSATGTESTLGVAYGGVGSGGFYAAIAPGTYTLAGKISATVDKDLAISTLSVPIADGKYYSYYISGFYDATTKKAEAFAVEDPFGNTTDFTTAYVRFVNAISNSPGSQLYAKNTTTGVELPVGGVIAYKSAGAFTPLPTGVYDLSTRVAGSTTNVIVRAGVAFVAGTVYTVGALGDYTVTSATAATRARLDLTANR